MRYYTQAEEDLGALRRRWAGLSPDDIDLTPVQRQIVTDLNVLLDRLDETETEALTGQMTEDLSILNNWIMVDEDNTTTRADIDREVAAAAKYLPPAGAAVLKYLAPLLVRLRDPDYRGISWSERDPRKRWIGLPTITMRDGSEIAYPVARLALLLWTYRPIDFTGDSPWGGILSACEDPDGEYIVTVGSFTLDAGNACELAAKVRNA
jgi:hypothetical protein